MRLERAELVEHRLILPGRWLQTYAAPWLAAGGARAGQFVHVRTLDDGGLVLRRPFSIDTLDRASGRMTIQFQTRDRGTEWLARTRPGDVIEMLGPLGRPFELDPRTRHVLLVAGGAGIAGVRALADEALEAGRQVTLLFGARAAAQVYPSSLLPPEVEYVVATDDGSLGQAGPVTDLLAAYEAWADQAFACGPWPMLSALARLATGRDARLGVARLGRRGGPRKAAARGTTAARRRAWLQVAFEQTIGCAAATCLGCVVVGVDGPQRLCREGPVFAADEIAWDDPAT